MTNDRNLRGSSALTLIHYLRRGRDCLWHVPRVKAVRYLLNETSGWMLEAQSVGIQLLPRSKVLRREPSAATISATSALSADTLTRSAVIGDLIRCHCVPSVVSKIVPLRPTTQHTVFVGA